MRTFQYSDAKSHKFWQIEVSGDSFTVTYGKVGSQGQTQTKSFPSAEKAQHAADKLIAEKVQKGYREATPTAARPTSLADTLEAAILEDPDDRAAHAALADHLHELGDPQGDFMQVQLALEDESLSPADRKKLQTKEKELLRKHKKDWVGEWTRAPETNREWMDREYEEPMTGGEPARFVRGVLAEARMGLVTVNRARAFVRDPNTRLVRRLFLGYFAWADYDAYEPGPDVPAEPGDRPAEHVLLRWPGLANVRVFQLGHSVEEEYDWCGFNCRTSGEHAHDFVKQMPNLEELYLMAHRAQPGKIAALSLPRLRVLQVYHNHDYPLERLAKNPSLGNLTHLLCHPHGLDDEHAYIRLKGLKAVVNSPVLKKLTHLRLRLADFGDKGAGEVVKSGILKRLKVLDLRHGRITDAGSRALAECPDLKNLELLDLSFNMLTAAGVDALKATGISVRLGHQQDPAEADDEDQEYLWQGDCE